MTGAVTTEATDAVELRIVLWGGPLDGDEYRSPRTTDDLPPLFHFIGPGNVPIAYERATERLFGPNAPARYVVDDQGRHVYRPLPPLLEEALVPAE